MAAEYPAAIKTYSTNVDLSTAVNAAYMNQRDQEITAIETALGIYPYGGALGMFQSLPALRAFWPMGSVDHNGSVFDLSGQGRTLSNDGDSLTTADIYSFSLYHQFNGIDTKLTRSADDGLNVGGQEAFIASSIRGLTVGGWFRVSDFGSGGYFIAKDDTTNRSYGLYHQLANLRFGVFNDAGTYFEDVSGDTLSVDTWYFLVGRATIGSHLVATFVNGEKMESDVGSGLTEIKQTAADFCIGARSDGGIGLDGRAAFCFMCGCALPDAIISILFSQTRGRFGV